MNAVTRPATVISYKTRSSANRWVERMLAEGHGNDGSPMPNSRINPLAKNGLHFECYFTAPRPVCTCVGFCHC